MGSGPAVVIWSDAERGDVRQEIAKMVSFIKDSPAMADNLEGEVLAPVSSHDHGRCAGVALA